VQVHVGDTGCGSRTASADTCTGCGERLTVRNTSWHSPVRTPEPVPLAAAAPAPASHPNGPAA